MAQMDPSNRPRRFLGFVLIALLVTVVGYGLGFLDSLQDLLLDIFKHHLHDRTVLAAILRLLGIGFAGALILLVLFAIYMLGSATVEWVLDSERKRRDAAIKHVEEAFRRYAIAPPILSSSDGDFLHVVLRMRASEWTSTVPFYSEFCDREFIGPSEETQESLEDNGEFPGDWVYSIFIERKKSAFHAVPISHAVDNDAECSVTVYFKISVRSAPIYASLYYIHRIFYEAKIPFLSFVLTGVCVFFMSILQQDLAQRWKSYCDNVLWPGVLTPSETAPAPPPRPTRFSHVEIRFNVSKKPSPPLMVPFRGRPDTECFQQISYAVLRFQAFQFEPKLGASITTFAED